MADEFDPLTRAVLDFDLAAVRQLVADGADLNARNEYGEPFLFDVILDVLPDDETSAADPTRYGFIRGLISMGADPYQLDSDGNNIFLTPVFAMDLTMVELLLDHGADPNHGYGDSDTRETIYDVALSDYDFECWSEAGLAFPIKKEISVSLSEDEFLSRVDEMARLKGVGRPEICKLLRRHGALSNREIVEKLGGKDSDRAMWRNGSWQLADPDVV